MKVRKRPGRYTGEYMSSKLEMLKGMSAEEILRKSGQLRKVPVDLGKIVSTLGLCKYSGTFEDIEKIKGKKVAGLIVLNRGDIGIFYDANATIEEKRFIIAHEIGHCCLHGAMLENAYIEYWEDDGHKKEYEDKESVFAARLLIPKEPLFSVYKKLLLPSLSGLADIFEVPQYLMEHRLKELNLIYYPQIDLNLTRKEARKMKQRGFFYKNTNEEYSNKYSCVH